MFALPMASITGQERVGSHPQREVIHSKKPAASLLRKRKKRPFSSVHGRCVLQSGDSRENVAEARELSPLPGKSNHDSNMNGERGFG
jgi:hypothetical protein